MFNSKIQPTDIAVVIPTFNRVHKLLGCLHSVYSQEHVTLHAIVIDDGSKDGTSEQVSQEYPQATILKGDGNFWWAKSLNTGIRFALDAGFNYILLLNDDNLINPGTVARLFEYVQDHPDTIVGAIALFVGTNEISEAGTDSNWYRSGPYKREHWHIYDTNYKGYIEVESLGGQSVLIHRKIFDKVGLLHSDKFPQYYGEIDFYLRAKKLGFKILVDLESIVWNIPNTTQRPEFSFTKVLHAVWRGYTWKGSPNNVLYTTRLFLRHCQPRYLLPLSLSRRLLAFPVGHVKLCMGLLRE
jgi:GT2 family glycosyltransferase